MNQDEIKLIQRSITVSIGGREFSLNLHSEHPDEAKLLQKYAGYLGEVIANYQRLCPTLDEAHINMIAALQLSRELLLKDQYIEEQAERINKLTEQLAQLLATFDRE